MPFNPEQQRAIDSAADENVLISAGAGSGKTKTLSSKVYAVCTCYGIKPSELLVLTFTNKAAFEMKERIIAEFRKNHQEGETLSDEILSAHIQTFDSFSLYLVQQYASVLNVPSTISIMDENVLQAKVNATLDQIFDELYERQDPAFLSMLSKFAMASDQPVKRIVVDLEAKLKNLLPSEAESFVKDYDEKFLSDAFLRQKWDGYLQGLRKKLKESLDRVYLCYTFDTGEDPFDLAQDLLHVDYKNVSLPKSPFGNEKMDAVFDMALSCLEEREDLFELAKNAIADKDFFNARGLFTDMEKDVVDKARRAFYDLRKAFKDDFLLPLSRMGSYQNRVDAIRSFKEDVHVLFAIVKELDRRLDEDKFLANAYTFSDIARMALSLLVDPAFDKARESITKRFRYILVDEYQDTNDFQETFLNALSQNATLFTVGDAKQAIYGFRNSNCQLFLDRKERYGRTGDGKHTVIDMNKNYRSVEKILDDVNKIFVNYMSREHGGITYTDKEMLSYDQGADLFKKARENEDGEYGIHLLSYEDAPEDIAQDGIKKECLTIVKDIQSKVREGYKVLDFVDGSLAFRPCSYKDFAILIQKRSHFDIYQKMFLDNGIPLNNEIKTGYHDIDCILTVQSLVKMLATFVPQEEGGTKDNDWHLFMSVARSYLFGKEAGYDDDRIYKTLQDKELWEKDPIRQKMKAFVFKERGKKFSAIFLDLLNEFHVLAKLPTVGDVDNNVSKIESYYQFLVNQENVGEGIHSFIELFRAIDHYSIDIGATSVTTLEDAVSLMTIHQSKGLEFKIVYMPLCDNVQNSGNNMDKADYTFSRSCGLLLPDYRLGYPIHSFLNNVYKETEGSRTGEISEHVRLFYVALTRPKETLYIVGKKSDLPSRSKETLLDMLDATFHYEGIDETILRRYASSFSKEDLLKYQEAIDFAERCAKLRFSFQQGLCDDNRATALSLFDELILGSVRTRLADSIDCLALSLYDDLVGKAGEDVDKAVALLFLYYAGIDLHKEDLSEVLERKADRLRQTKIPLSLPDIRKDARDFLAAVAEAKKTEFIKAHTAVRNPKFAVRGAKGLSDEESMVKRKTEALWDILPVLLKAVENDATDFKRTFYPEFESRSVSLQDIGEKKGRAPVLPTYEIDDTPIVCPHTERRRASKFVADADLPERGLLDRGTRLHRYMELADLREGKAPDDLFGDDEQGRKAIRSVLALPFFSNLKDAAIFKEYPYFDEELQSEGIVDLLVVRKDEIDIVDYKLKKIDDAAYLEQLRTYRRNIGRLFGPERPIRTYLLSLLDCRIEEVK